MMPNEPDEKAEVKETEQAIPPQPVDPQILIRPTEEIQSGHIGLPKIL